MPSPSRRNAANFVALTAIQASNAIVPILIYPFVLSRIGAEIYAQLAIGEALSIIVLTAVLFSFEVEGVSRTITARTSKDPLALSRLVSSIVMVRMIMFLLAGACVVAGYAAIRHGSASIMALWLLVPLGHVFFSYWFFQGMEMNAPVAVATVIARITSVVLIYLYVKVPGDAALVPIAIGLPFLIAGISTAIYLAYRFRLRFIWVGMKELRSLVWHGREIVLGNIAVMLYRDFNVVLLGLSGVSASGLAAYSLAEKLVKMLQASVRPLNQLFFPKAILALSNEIEPNRRNARIIAKMLVPQEALVLLFIASCVATYFTALHVPGLHVTTYLPREAMSLALVMLPAILAGIANFMFGIVGLNYLNAKGEMLRAICLVGVASIVSSLTLSKFLGAWGGAITFLLAEFTLLLLIMRIYRIEARQSPLVESGIRHD